MTYTQRHGGASHGGTSHSGSQDGSRDGHGGARHGGACHDGATVHATVHAMVPVCVHGRVGWTGVAGMAAGPEAFIALWRARDDVLNHLSAFS